MSSPLSSVPGQGPAADHLCGWHWWDFSIWLQPLHHQCPDFGMYPPCAPSPSQWVLGQGQPLPAVDLQASSHLVALSPTRPPPLRCSTGPAISNPALHPPLKLASSPESLISVDDSTIHPVTGVRPDSSLPLGHQVLPNCLWLPAISSRVSSTIPVQTPSLLPVSLASLPLTSPF